MQTVEDHLTFLLPRPIWVNDIDVSNCNACGSVFGHLRRRHHCRHCGNIYCHDCSSRKVPLPQLGYGSKPVRVCNGCFEVAYLVTYAIDEDHGLTTQIHGARGLLELTEKDDEKDLHNMVAHGGIDALIWLCRTATDTEIHHLITTNLAILAEKESIRPVIITKWALPPLLRLLQYYVHYHRNDTTSSLSSSSSPLHSDAQSSAKTVPIVLPAAVKEIDNYTVHLEIIINCTHVIYQLARAGILSQEEIITDGILGILFSLTLFRVNTAMETLLQQQDGNLSEKNDQGKLENDYVKEQWKERESIIQSLAAKSISFISATVANQPSIIEQLRSTENLALPLALVSPNDEVKKYIAKTVAYLSLRNDKYKPLLLGGDKVRALLSILVALPQSNPELEDTTEQRKSDFRYYVTSWCNDIHDMAFFVSTGVSEHAPYTSAVSHICCALANFATNGDSQVILMAQPHLLHYICNVPSKFPQHLEIHRHVARCLANLALYEKNISKMTSIPQQETDGNTCNVIPTLLALGQNANVTKDIQRQIIRALDNLTSNGLNSESVQFWKSAFQDIRPLIEKIMNVIEEPDTLKRANLILRREQYVDQSSDKQACLDNGPDLDNIKENHAAHGSGSSYNGSEEDEQHGDSTEVDQQSTARKTKSKKKNKKKKH